MLRPIKLSHLPNIKGDPWAKNLNTKIVMDKGCIELDLSALDSSIAAWAYSFKIIVDDQEIIDRNLNQAGNW